MRQFVVTMRPSTEGAMWQMTCGFMSPGVDSIKAQTEDILRGSLKEGERC